MGMLFCRDQHGQPETSEYKQEPVSTNGPAILEAGKDVRSHATRMGGVVNS
ncbi:hypothetical protein PO883_30480 [Massilia sp. DJPM01]|uniref:hypothetical protein n=1 Tax=Massilia sp. DJPM01 TaxID=3024404 RepID=UPI00259E6902|nr:hypothetical protein [Massilia sp. DJPM01]MDM5181509.1 hypothetical protein [Massilia sp. DJPM01]